MCHNSQLVNSDSQISLFGTVCLRPEWYNKYLNKYWIKESLSFWVAVSSDELDQKSAEKLEEVT